MQSERTDIHTKQNIQMIRYNPKHWFLLIFNPYSSHVVRALMPILVFITVFTFLICYLVLDVYSLRTKEIHGTGIVHSLLGIVLGLFLVFRTNSAYDRWWEGRKLWGLMVNNTRNMAQKISVFLGQNDLTNRRWFACMIPNFSIATKEHLRDNTSLKELESVDNRFFDFLSTVQHIPNSLSFMMYQRIAQLYKEKKIDGYQLFLLDKELKEFSDILGGCERIKNTPIPYSYTLYIKKFIFIYLITLPFGFVTIMGYVTVLVVLLVSYLLLSIELIAEEIEDPFGHDINDLPTDELTRKIKRDVQEILNLK